MVLLRRPGMVVFGWQNFLTGFGSFRMPSMLPIAYLYIAIPLCGACLVALFAFEQIVNGCATALPCPVGSGRACGMTGI